MERLEEQTTYVQGALLVAGAVLFLSEGFGVSRLAGVDPTTLGVGVYALAFAIATAGSLLVGKRIQAGLQGTAALGFFVVLVSTLASLGLVVSLLGAALVVLPVLGQVYLQRKSQGGTEARGSARARDAESETDGRRNT